MFHTPLYYFGMLIMVAGVAWGAFTLGVPTTWIAIAAVILTGLVIMSAVGSRSYYSSTVVPRATITATPLPGESVVIHS